MIIKIFLKAIFAITTVYSLILFLFFIFQERMIFFPTQLDKNFKFTFEEKFTENILNLKSGGEINYLIFKVPNPRGVILYFRGNAGALNDWGEVAQELAKRTRNEVWIMDYPGAGKSTGDIPKNEVVIIKMGHEFISKIQKEQPELPIYLYGRSIGSGIAGVLSRTEKIKGLILETPYTSLRNLAEDLYPWIPSVLLRFDLDNTRVQESRLSDILIFHGTKDEVIPYHHGEQLSQFLGARAKFVSIPGGHHNDLSSFSKYWIEIDGYFLNK